MKKQHWALLTFLLGVVQASPAIAAGEDHAAIFQQANAAYRGGDYAKAGSLYESLISRDWKRANVFYNLGNAYFKQKKLGLAILNYEKAKRLSPLDRDSKANLTYVRGLLEYRIEDKRNWYLKMMDRALASFTPIQIGIVSLSFAFLFLMSWTVSLYLASASGWGWRRKTLLILTAICLSLWLSKGIHQTTVREAVVIKDQAAVRYGPSYKDQISFKLGEGIKVRVKKTEGEWSRVILTNGETGWMVHEEIGVI